MFSFLVALTLYMSFAPSLQQPAVKAADLFPQPRAFLPVAAPAEPPLKVALAPVKEDVMRIGVQTDARSAAVMDWRTGKVLFAKNADTPYPIASITKLVTALVALDQGVDMNKTVEFLPQDVRKGGVPYIIPGEKLKVGDLFHVSLIASGNGATVALARATGLSSADFAAKMNAMAAKIGMRDAHFVEPTGLDPRDQASAKDVALLIRAALQHPEIRDTVSMEDYRFTAETGLAHHVRSTDELLGSKLSLPPYAFLGGKTGYLDEAGYCFGAAAQDASGDKIVAVALGTPAYGDRFRAVKDMIYWAFDAYKWPATPGE